MLVVRVGVVVIALGLASIPFVTLFETALGGSTESSATLLQSGSLPVSTQAATSSQTARILALSCTQDGEIGILLAVHQVDLGAGTLTANVSMCLDRIRAHELLHLPALGLGPPLVTIPGSGGGLSVSLTRLARSQVQTQSSFAPTHAFVPVGSVTLPLQGSQRRYPFDSYATLVSVSELGFCDIGPPTTYVVADPGVGSFDWSFASPRDVTIPPATETRTPGGKLTARCGGAVAELAIEGSRPAATKLFVLCLVAIPLLLLGLLALRLSEGTPRSIDGLVGVTAIMLAILPIRTVLVPGDISSLTLVDFALASEMAVLATGTVLWFVWPRRGGRTSAAEPPAAQVLGERSPIQ